MTGLRRGEIVGLRWEDVDLERGTVRVVRQLQAHRGAGLVEVAPKSAASRRTLMVDHATVGVLSRHRWRQQQEAQGHGRVWDRGGECVHGDRWQGVGSGAALTPVSEAEHLQ